MKKALPRFLQGRPLTGLLLAYCAGILVCLWLRPSWTLALGLLSFCLLSAALLGFSGKNMGPALLLTGVALGLFLCGLQLSSLGACRFPENQALVLEGRMRGGAIPMEEDRFRITFAISAVEGEPYSCALVYLYGEGKPPAPGSWLRVKAETYSPAAPGNANAFDYQAYLERQGIGAAFYVEDSGLEVVREGAPWTPAFFSAWLRHCLDQALAPLSSQHRALVEGVFLGDKSGLSPSSRSLLGLTGIAHAFAVSGLHVGYVALLAAALAGSGYRRRWRRLGVTCLFLLFYLGLTGARPSILRADLMALTLLAAGCLDEPRDLPTVLSLAALLSLAWKPLWLLDAGFQLSYGAVLGITVYQKHWERLLPAWGKGLREGLATGLAATTLTLPLTAYYFYHISWLGCLLSPLAVLAAGLSVCLCLAGALAALVWTGLASLLLQTAVWPLSLLYGLAEFLSGLPFTASISGAVPLWLTGLVLALILWWPSLWQRLRPWAKPYKWIPANRMIPLGATVLLLLFPLLPPVLQRTQAQTAEVIFLDVGQGDATLVVTEENYTILIDGGGSRDSGAVGQYTLLPYLKSRAIDRIDLVVSTHPDQDHIDGLLTVLEELPVGAVCYSSQAETNSQHQRLLDLAQRQNCRLIPIRGQTIRLGQGTALWFYPPLTSSPSHSNEASLVCRLASQGVHILLTGDAPATALEEMAERYDLSADVVHLPHHGSETGYAPDFYQATGSEAAVISVGAGNRYGHPADSVVQYWQSHGDLYRTDQQGAITLRIQDGDFTVETYR